MNKFIIKGLIGSLVISGITFLGGCSKFDQDFIRNPINELTVTTTETSFSLVQFEKLEIPVTITSSRSESGTYSYTWKAIADDSVYVISDKKDLDITVEIPPGSYDLQYTITDDKNGLTYNNMYRLTVNGAFYEGWLVTHNGGNQGKLTFVRSDHKMFDDPASDVNNIVFPGKAIAAFYSAIQFYSEYASIHYFTDAGVYRFDPNNFLLTGKTDEVLPGVSHFGNIAYGASVLGADQYIVNDANVHAGMGSFYANQILMPYSEGLSGDYELFPAVITTAQLATYFYDNKEKRFLQIPYLGRELLPATSAADAVFNMAKVGKTMIAADKGRTSSSSGVFYFVMEDPSGRYFYSLNGSTPAIFQKVEDSKCPDFSMATSFATSGIFEHMYYAVNNKLYLYNMVANTAELLYSFPAGQDIKDIEMKRSTSKTLAVATVNGDSGTLHLFEIDDLGHFVRNAPSKSLTGFGNIVHISPR